MENHKLYKNFVVKKGKNEDLVELIKLLEQLPPKGMLFTHSQQLLHFFLKYLLNNPLGIIVFAVEKNSGRAIGYVIAIRDPVVFWSKFILHHFLLINPLPFIKKLWSFIKDIISTFLKHSENKNQLRFKKTSDNLNKFTWSPSNFEIARIIFIGVLMDFQKIGLGSELYSFLAEILKKEGCKKIEAHIDADNEPSLKLHKNTGWHIEKLKDGDYKAILKL